MEPHGKGSGDQSDSGAIVPAMLAFFALFETSYNRICSLTASAVADWAIFSMMDVGILPARHLSDHNLFLYAVHRH